MGLARGGPLNENAGFPTNGAGFRSPFTQMRLLKLHSLARRRVDRDSASALRDILAFKKLAKEFTFGWTKLIVPVSRAKQCGKLNTGEYA